MFTKDDLEKIGINSITKNIDKNKGIVLDCRLFYALVSPNVNTKIKDYNYDFDVYLKKYGINLQRPYVWKRYQQQEFIMSILLEKPIDPIIVVQYVHDTNRENCTNFIIDGKQRLMTIQKFGRNKFPITVDGNEVYYKDFDEKMKLYFQSRVNFLSANVYYSYYYDPITDDEMIALFNYYNFTGTPQAKKHKDMLESLVKNIT